MGAARARHGAADLARSACPDRRARRTDPEADFAARAYRAGCGPYQAEDGRHRQSLPSIARGRSIAPGDGTKPRPGWRSADRPADRAAYARQHENGKTEWKERGG